MAVVGRPNVGKSTLFNRIVGHRTAIVEDRARTTRDRLYGEAEWNGRRFVVVDTGGLERRPGDPIEAKVQEQARLAIAEADLILFVVDAATGETAADQETAELLRRARVPVIVVTNKADSERREYEAAEFHRFGWEDTYAVSALHGRGTGDLLDAVVWALPPESEEERERKRSAAEAEEFAELAALAEAQGVDLSDVPAQAPRRASSNGTPGAAAVDEPDEAKANEEAVAAWDRRAEADRLAALQPIAVAIVGRPNVGKSSLLNALLGEERVIVSDIPGTTRDAIDTTIEWNGRLVTLIDTAGVRRRGKVANGPAFERFSALRALRALGRCDVAILVIDCVDGLTRQDAHVAGYVVEEGKGLVVALNKWDLVEKDTNTFAEYVAAARREAQFLDFAPMLAISAKTGQRVGRVLDTAMEIAAQRRRRVPTGELNRLLADATFRQSPPAVRGTRPKFYYATQASVAPPTFVLFVSDGAAVHFSYARYLENRIRDVFDFGGTPIRLVFRTRTRTQIERRRGSPRLSRRSAGGARPNPGSRDLPRRREEAGGPGGRGHPALGR
ncbi:MAG: ribosome biogenesis GTPase Der [Candidatus Limnocylindrales bacterium]